MTLGHVQSAQGHGWEVGVGRKTYWFGRGLRGSLLGAFSSVVDLLDAFDADNAQAGLTGVRFDLATDKRMTAEADLDASPDDRSSVYALKLDGKIVGFCVETADGALQTLYGDLASASLAAHAGKDARISPR